MCTLALHLRPSGRCSVMPPLSKQLIQRFISTARPPLTRPQTHILLGPGFCSADLFALAGFLLLYWHLATISVFSRKRRRMFPCKFISHHHIAASTRFQIQNFQSLSLSLFLYKCVYKLILYYTYIPFIPSLEKCQVQFQTKE